ncbi:hypothetical protein Q8F55_000167 [Vanrija albida]|uniref:Amino acid transporter transmembrane domain-containing protein n=1 Tax=Vanrija albida TaxID=181172 RepID=A0ABR3QCM8_9TREE
MGESSRGLLKQHTPTPSMKTDSSDKIDALDTVQSQTPDADDVEGGKRAPETDGVFGDLDEDSKEYRSVTAMGAFVLMTKANLGMGVLGLPAVFHTVGLIPGYILLVSICALMTYTVMVIGPFKRNHPECYSVADALFLIWGKVGREIMSVQFVLGKTFVVAGALVSVSTALNAVSVHGACTAVFIAVAAVAGFLLSSIRTLHKLTWLAWVGLVSIVVALLIVTVAVGIQDRPAAAPQTGPWDKKFRIIGHPNFSQTITSVTTVIFAYAATPVYFSILCEMKEPRKYQRTMVISMWLCCACYLAIGTVMYYYCGQYISSPSLGSAGPLVKRISYGIVLPALLVTLCLYAHITAKFVFVRLLVGTYDLSHPTKKHWAVWLGVNFAIMAAAYILASAIPIFSLIVSFIGAICSTPGTLLPFPLMWWYDSWRGKTWAERNKWAGALNLFIVVLAFVIIVSGTYGGVVELIKAQAKNGPWTCADNSNSVKK